nr:baculoviral IAP repeat-containing protein 3-like [Procambarus clarkii]
MVQVQQERPPFETHTSPTHINEDQLDKLIKELDIIEAVISMGFPKNHVMTTFHNQLKEKGIPFFNLESCIEAILSHMENENRKALNLASNRETEVEVKVSTSSQHVALTEVDVVPSPPIFGDITAKTELASNQEIEEEVQNLSPPQAEAVTLIQAIDELKPPMSITQMVPVLKPPVSVGSSGKIGQTSLERICECKICMDAEIELVFIPCSHMVACSKCALALFICPICRTDIKFTIRPISS